MMPIRDVVIFPYMMTPFVVGRESSVRALEDAMAGDKKIFLATQHDASIDEPTPGEIFAVGCVVNIVQSLKLPDGNIKVLVEGVERAKVVSHVADDEEDIPSRGTHLQLQSRGRHSAGRAHYPRDDALRAIRQAESEPELRDDGGGNPGGRSGQTG